MGARVLVVLSVMHGVHAQASTKDGSGHKLIVVAVEAQPSAWVDWECNGEGAGRYCRKCAGSGGGCAGLLHGCRLASGWGGVHLGRTSGRRRQGGMDGCIAIVFLSRQRRN